MNTFISFRSSTNFPTKCFRFLGLGMAGLLSIGTISRAATPNPPNVLFIMVDDLRPQLGCYGAPVVKTPNIDRLAASGIVLERAYCQQALCVATRASLLTGLRPDTTGVFRVKNTNFRARLPNVVTLPGLFKLAGYQTEGMGKIFHASAYIPAASDDRFDDPQSWTRPHWITTRPVYGPEGDKLLRQYTADGKAEGFENPLDGKNVKRSFAYESPDIPDADLADGELTDHALARMKALKDAGSPFFLAVGFIRPHHPYVAPKRYWDLYKDDELPMPDNVYRPKGAPAYSYTNLEELRGYYEMNFPPEGPVPAKIQRDLVHAYLACISFVDAQVGRLLAELDQLGIRENTIVVLLGDNGQQVGEHGMFIDKQTNFETSTHVPLIVSAPGKIPAGGRTSEFVEFVDIYPTVAQLAGLAAPTYLEGCSFLPLAKDPHLPWKKVAFSQYDRGGRDGRSIRTDRYRFTMWTGGDYPSPDLELYDHHTDPEENENIAANPANKAVIEKLKAQLAAGWKAALPPPVAPDRLDRK